MKRVAWEKLVDFGADVLKKKGMPEAAAQQAAEVAVMTEAMGVGTHGVVMFSYLNDKLGAEIDPAAEPEVVREKGATAVIDAHACAGSVAMARATQLAMDKAREFGVAMIGVRNALWMGALGVYLVPLAEEGFFAQLWAQTATCKDCAPLGGIDARFSTNPVAIAFPTSGEAVLADFSTAAMSLGKAYKMMREGSKAPEPLFMDKDGQFSDDPAVMDDGGTLLFTGGRHGGHKGYALSLWCEALTALTGGSCNNPDVEQRQTFSLIVADPDAFAGNDYYYAEMNRFIAHVRSSRTLPGVDAIRLPGERAFRSVRESIEEGVPVDERVAGQLAELAKEHGLKDPLA